MQFPCFESYVLLPLCQLYINSLVSTIYKYNSKTNCFLIPRTEEAYLEAEVFSILYRQCCCSNYCTGLLQHVLSAFLIWKVQSSESLLFFCLACMHAHSQASMHIGLHAQLLSLVVQKATKTVCGGLHGNTEHGGKATTAPLPV